MTDYKTSQKRLVLQWRACVIGSVRYPRIFLCYFCFRQQTTWCLLVWLVFSVRGQYKPCSQLCTGSLHVYTTVYTACTQPHTWSCTRSCSWPAHGRLHGRVDGPYTTEYGPYSAVFTARTWPVHAVYTAVFTARTRRRTRLVYTYTRPVNETYRICNFLTDCCDYIHKQSKAPYCLSPEVY